MKTTKKAEVMLTLEDLEKIITREVENENPGYKVQDIDFMVGGHEDPDDYHAEHSLEYTLDAANVTMVKRE